MTRRRLQSYEADLQTEYNEKEGLRKRVNFFNARQAYDVDEHTILYNAFYGRGVCCNPYALFSYLLKDARFKKYRHVWVLDNLAQHEAEKNEYENYDNVSFVEFESEGHMEYLAKAKYLVNNSAEQSYFVKKPGQVLINTWHGIPLKTMGFDIPGGGATIGNTLRNFMMDDYLLSMCPFMSDMYRKAYKLKNIYEGCLLETGYPRCDTLFSTSKEALKEKLDRYGVQLDLNKKIILYAPTWKGVRFFKPDVDLDRDMAYIETLYHYVDKEKYQILYKPHQIVYKTLMERGLAGYGIVPGSVDANELLAVTDILISDYSSIFFDFLVTGRPVLFYIPDLAQYQEKRGLYLPVDKLPGPVTDDVSQLGQWLSALCQDEGVYQKLFPYENYETAKKTYVPNEDGHACERVVERIFFGKTVQEHRLKTDKKKLLMHVDVLKSNGITASAINLLRCIDYEKYDVSLFANVPENEPHVWGRIPKEVRSFAKVGGLGGSIEQLAKKEYCNDHGIIISDDDPLFPKEIFEAEYKRIFGDCRFDVILNFSGYSAYWSNIYYTAAQAKKIIWMHSDLKAELTERVVDGVHMFEKNLPQVFRHYENMDLIVGCSPSTMKVNREKLATEKTRDKFTAMHNVLDYEQIYEKQDQGTEITIEGTDYLVIGEEKAENGMEYIVFLPTVDDTCINFVNVGRLSPEKNQLNLVRAFARLAKEHDDVRLYIIGDGPLKSKLRNLIRRLGLDGKVILTGNISNPFYFVKRCQCFILPSYYEGLPIVLLEARTMGLPIIVSDFPTVEDSLYKNGQLVIGTDEDSILEGMELFLEGRVPNGCRFQPEEYNKKCIEEFDALLQ